MRTTFAAILIDPPRNSTWVPDDGNTGFQFDFSGADGHLPRLQTVRQLQAAGRTIGHWLDRVRGSGLYPVFLSMNLGSEASVEFRSHDDVPLIAPDLFPDMLASALDYPDGDWIERYWAALGQAGASGTFDHMPGLAHVDAFGLAFRDWLDHYLAGFDAAEAALLDADAHSFAKADWFWQSSGRSHVLLNRHCPLIALSARETLGLAGGRKIRLSAGGMLRRLPGIEGLIESAGAHTAMTVAPEQLKAWLGDRVPADSALFAAAPGVAETLAAFGQDLRAMTDWLRQAAAVPGGAGAAPAGQEPLPVCTMDFEAAWGQGRLTAGGRQDGLHIAIRINAADIRRPVLTLQMGEKPIGSAVELVGTPVAGEFSAGMHIGVDDLARDDLQLVLSEDGIAFFGIDLNDRGD